MLFSLLHNPCTTTIYTIYKETGSAKWTTVAALLPLAMGFVVTFLVAQVWRLVALTLVRRRSPLRLAQSICSPISNAAA